MNQLNSTLLEGELLGTPSTTYDPCPGGPKTVFEIESHRINPENLVKTFTTIGIVTYSELAETCEKHLDKGRAVRVVGRLAEDENGDIVIIADHVEFKAKVAKPQAVEA